MKNFLKENWVDVAMVALFLGMFSLMGVSFWQAASRKLQPKEDTLAAGAFSLGCVTAIKIANETDRPIKGDELVLACANYWLTNEPGIISNVLVTVVKQHTR